MTEKEKEELRKIRERQLAIKSDIGGIKDKITAENRGMTDEESNHVKDLQAEKDRLALRAIELENPTVIREIPKPEKSQDQVCAEVMRSLISGKSLSDDYNYLRAGQDPTKIIIPESREIFAENYKAQYRDTAIQGLADSTPVVPISVGDIIQPLEKGLILDKVGLHIQTGIQGVWNYPVVEAVTAEWAGENDQATSKKVNLSMITPKPHRMTLQVNVSNRAIWQSGSAIRNIVLTQIQAGLQRKLNETMFKLVNADATGNVPDGCFANALAGEKITQKTNPTYADINSLRAAVEGTGIQHTAPAFVCNTAMFYLLKSTPRANATGIMIIDGAGTIDGTPVFVTEYIPANTLGYGMFGYELLGQFGPMSLSVDANSAAVAGLNMTAFVLNGDWDMKAFRNEAFGYIQVSAA